MTTPLTPEAQTRERASDERAAMLRWVGLVVALLGGSLALQLSMLGIASGDPSAVAEPDYYRKAVAWDEERAQQARNRELGWTVDVVAGASDAGDHTRALTLLIKDREGRPVEGLAAQVHMFHKARAGSPLDAVLPETAPGRYGERLSLQRVGRWELRLTLTRGSAGAAQRFTLRRDVELTG
ncbi:MAG: FixH family protein [Planctomycetota bacterium]